MFLLCLTISAPAQTNDSPTTRIVSLVPALTEIAFELDAGDQVVGVSRFCQFPPEAATRPKAGGLLNPDLENVLRMSPTVVVLYRSQSDFAGRLGQLGINAQLYDLDRLEHLYAAIKSMGAITGQTVQSTSLAATMRTSFDQIQKHAANRPRVKALVVVSRDRSSLRHIYQAGPGNFLGELLQLAGGEHAIHGTAAISREQIILGNPEIIIDMSEAESGAQPGMEKAAQAVWAELTTVSAVKNKRVHIMADPHALVPSHHLPAVAQQFQQLLHKEPTPKTE